MSDESQPLKMAREVVAAGSWLYGPGEAEDICAEFVAIVDAAQLATVTTERDEARSRLAKARVEIEGIDEAVLSAELDTASAIAAWLDERYDVHEMGSNASAIVCRSAAADIRANAWRSK